ncbi:MAG: tRNA (adenosine(37)-N6)-threonylcarbamoyltransferase complex transferase subunit TsaD [Bacteroidales bacterium]
MHVTILAIESSCDDTSAALVRNGMVLSNLIANQKVHRNFGGVVPELASRAHQQNVVPVVDQALKEAGVEKNQLSAVAFTQGPGLLGSLLVGVSFAKGLALSLGIPLIGVNHLHAHILAHWAKEPGKQVKTPHFPFLCLLVSGGHTQLVVARGHLDMEVIGQTVDDAAGEAFDKCAKVLGIPYPGGPVIDRISPEGNPHAFSFARPRIEGLDFSFSGLKTSFLYLVREEVKKNPRFIEERKADLSASIQHTIVELLMDKLEKASEQTGIREIGIAGGVSANKYLRNVLEERAKRYGWNIYIPEFIYTTDNAGMIGVTAYYKYLAGERTGQETVPLARFPM